MVSEQIKRRGEMKLHDLDGETFAAKSEPKDLFELVCKEDVDEFQLYMKYHLSTCERQDLLGVSSHALDVFRKEQ